MPPVDPIPLDDLPIFHRVLVVLQQVADALNGRTSDDLEHRQEVRQLTAALVRDVESRDAWRVWFTTTPLGQALLVSAATWAFGSSVIEAVSMFRSPL